MARSFSRSKGFRSQPTLLVKGPSSASHNFAWLCVVPVLGKAFIPSLIYCASYIATVDTTITVFSYDAVWTDNRTHHLPGEYSGCVTCYTIIVV